MCSTKERGLSQTPNMSLARGWAGMHWWVLHLQWREGVQFPEPGTVAHEFERTVFVLLDSSVPAIPCMGWLKQQAFTSYISGGWGFKINTSQIQVSKWRSISWFIKHWPPTCLLRAVKARKLSGSLSRAAGNSPINEGLSLITNLRPPPDLSPWGLGFQHVNFGRTQTFKILNQLQKKQKTSPSNSLE